MIITNHLIQCSCAYSYCSVKLGAVEHTYSACKKTFRMSMYQKLIFKHILSSPYILCKSIKVRKPRCSFSFSKYLKVSGQKQLVVQYEIVHNIEEINKHKTANKIRLNTLIFAAHNSDTTCMRSFKSPPPPRLQTSTSVDVSCFLHK